LLGFLRLPGVKADEELGAWRLLTGMAFVAFGLSLVPGMFGGALGELEAYVPPPSADSALRGSQSAGLKWIKDDYQAAISRAKQENKLVFVSFTGYACSNCHWMKANMFPRSEIASALGQYVLVELYTDGLDAASDRNQAFQESKFQMVAIPFYAIVDANENIVATFAGPTRDTAVFREFLERKAASGG
jgi:thiol:disulfide interchange protein DsbD